MKPAAPDEELDSRVAHARGRANRLEHDLRHDVAAHARIEELQRALRGALNAMPRVRADVLVACDDIDAYGAP